MTAVAKSMLMQLNFKEAEEFEDRFNAILWYKKNQKKLYILKSINIMKKLNPSDNVQKKLHVLMYELLK